MTAQFPDRLIFNEQVLEIPGGGPLLGAWQDRQRPKFRITCTACWRGYVAEWEIKDGWLRVTSIRAALDSDDSAEEECLFRLFPGHDCAVAASWFSGLLVAGCGDGGDMPMQFTYVYPHYRLFHVDHGRVVSTEEHTKDWWYTQHPNVTPRKTWMIE